MDYLRLLRLPNAFTAIADVAMGFLFVHQGLSPPLVFACLAVASVHLYLAGMVLNDVWDVEIDRVARPERPLAAGRISVRTARRLGFGLLTLGVASGWLAGFLGLVPEAIVWRAGVVASLLAINVVLYDGVLKRTVLGPVGMGICRFLNVLLGMAVAAPAGDHSLGLGFASYQFVPAAGIGLYIVGVTWFARGRKLK